MRNFIIACQFLTRITIIPNLEVREGEMASSARAYPLVGFVLGLFLLLLFTALNDALGFPILTTAIILVIAEIFVTGGLHLDGLMDCADGLFSYRPKERILEIMKDSHVGANAVLALVSMILLKVALLLTVLPEHPWILVFMPLVSRWVMVDLAVRFPYAGKLGSLGGTIIGQVGTSEFRVATISALMAVIGTIVLGTIVYGQNWLFVTLLALFSWLITALAARYLARNTVKKIDGITGDVLGAILEISEVVMLLVGAIFIRIFG